MYALARNVAGEKREERSALCKRQDREGKAIPELSRVHPPRSFLAEFAPFVVKILQTSGERLGWRTLWGFVF
jgi:hypothetical protein